MKHKCITALVFLLLLAAVPAAAQVAPYQSYTYDFWRNMVAAPQAYIPVRAVSGQDIGVGALKGPQDLFAAKDGDIYIADSGNHRIIHVNKDFELVRVISGFDNQGKSERFNNPRGLHVAEDGTIYIADRDNNRVVVLDSNAELVRIIDSPAKDRPDQFASDFRFRPDKLSVDKYRIALCHISGSL